MQGQAVQAPALYRAMDSVPRTTCPAWSSYFLVMKQMYHPCDDYDDNCRLHQPRELMYDSWFIGQGNVGPRSQAVESALAKRLAYSSRADTESLIRTRIRSSSQRWLLQSEQQAQASSSVSYQVNPVGASSLSIRLVSRREG